MRVRVIIFGLVLALGFSAVGCKSAPKMSWWKTADKTDPSAAASTAQTTAPQLPSEAAKQAEALASSTNIKITTESAPMSAASTSAPAYTAATTASESTAPAETASPYPSTGAQGYLPAITSADTSANSSTGSTPLANSALPYNPTAVPPASPAMTSASVTTATADNDRYGLVNQDRYANAYPSTATSEYSPAQPPQSSAPVTGTPSATQSSSVPFASYPGSPALGDRYATQPISVPATSTAPSFSPSVQPASAVASVQPYRPGGTSSYPGTSANYEVATRPEGSSGSTTAPVTYPGQSGSQYR